VKALPLVGLSCLLWTAPAFGQEGAAETNYRPEPERRDGFTIGLAGGLGIGQHRGYPNTYDDLNNPASEANTGVGFANGGSLWIGGALRDWLTVAVGSFGGGNSGNDLVGSGGAFGMRVEAYPLFDLGGRWRDLGLGAEFGIGGSTILDADEKQVADGGAMSMVGIGAFFEAFSLWHYTGGPTLMYAHQYSESLNRHMLLIGWRNALYWTLENS
jgi:hypothetical protein